MILHGHDLATKPWEQDKFHVHDPALLEWAHHHHHYALLGLIISSDMLLGRMRSLILQTTNVQGDVKLLNLLVESQKFNREVDGLFKGAASGGHRDRIERLLAAKADVMLLLIRITVVLPYKQSQKAVIWRLSKGFSQPKPT